MLSDASAVRCEYVSDASDVIDVSEGNDVM